MGACTVQTAIADARVAQILTAKAGRRQGLLQQVLSQYKLAEVRWPDADNFRPSLLDKKAVVLDLMGEIKEARRLRGVAARIREGWKSLPASRQMQEDQSHIQALPKIYGVPPR